MKFEIHITGSDTTIAQLIKMGKKTITVGVMSPDGYIMRYERMSSYIEECSSYHEVFEKTKLVVDELVDVVRVKIECQYSQELTPLSLYIESHFELEHISSKHPTSVTYSGNKLGKLIGTDRSFDKSKFDGFSKKYNKDNCIVELCLLDTYQSMDTDWFETYNATN